MGRYLVLQDATGNWQRTELPVFAPLRPADPTVSGQPQIIGLDLSPVELREIAAEPSTLALAPVLTTQLVQPHPMDGLRDGDCPADWGVDAVGADESPVTGKGAKIALLDTGIDRQHPTFDGVTLIGHDAVGTGLGDANGHGSHIAATVLGRGIDGHKVGVAQGVTQLYVSKAIPDSGHGQTDMMFESLLWALDQKAEIIALSVSLDVVTQIDLSLANGMPFTLAVENAVHAYRGNLRVFEIVLRMLREDKQPLILAPVGNDCRRMIAPDFETGPSTPAAARGVLSVGAVGPSVDGYVPAPFSNLNPAVCAPGVGILSAAPGGGSRELNGTTMAMAHTAGVAAQWSETLRAQGVTPSGKSLARQLLQNATLNGMATGTSRLDRGSGLVQAPQI